MEIQDLAPQHPIPLARVGFRGVRRRILVNSPEGRITIDLDMDLYISIGGDRRGAHLSRNIEALHQVIGPGESTSIEDYLFGVASRLLELHKYAYEAVAVGRTVYYVPVSFAEIRGLEPVDVIITAYARRDGTRRWITSVTVTGLSVCPSAQETIRRLTGLDPAPSHVQRVRVTGRVESRGEIVRIEEIAKALLSSVSAPTFTLLKRRQEAKLVYEAHKRPRFAEDIAREALASIARLLEGRLPGDTLVEAEVESYESIHPHNVYALARGRLFDILSTNGDLDV